MEARPHRITTLSIFFAAGAMISLVSGISLLFPESFLQPMWKLNPRAEQVFHHVGFWAIVLMFVVSLSCVLAAYGLWLGRLWGYHLAIGLLLVNLIGDIYNFASGTEPRAVIGIPIVLLVLASIMTSRIRAFFHNKK